MKKILIILFISAATTAHAQIEQGTIALTGNLAYTSTKVESSVFSNDASSFSTNVQGAMFVQENLSLGLSVGYSSSEDTHLYAFGPFIRKYFMTSETFGWYAQGGFAYLTGDASDGNVDLSGFAGALSPGIVFFPGEKIGIELMMTGLTYSSQKQSAGGQELTTKNFNINFNPLDFTVGASFYFGR